MKRLKKVVTAAALLSAVALPALVVAPAQAATRDGKCDTGELCYYYNSNVAGSLSDFRGSVDDYGAKQPSCYEFKSRGAGRGLCVKNHAASVWNRTGKPVRVYFNSGYSGASQEFASGTKGNLRTGLKNENASHQLVSGSAPTTCTTDGTNSTAPSTILVYRVNLGRVERVSFKSYVKNVLPNEWISSWPKESLKSGAMAVKSYAWYWALHSTRRTPNGACYDVRDDTGDQVYRPGSAVASTSAAVDATWGTRMTRNGSILKAHYCATSTACGAWVSGDWLSQNGSADLARDGKGYATILRHYYRDVRVG
jgi:hypothetical protein